MSKFGRWLSDHEEDAIIIGSLVGLTVLGGVIGFKIGKTVALKKGVALGVDKGMEIGIDVGMDRAFDFIAEKGVVPMTKYFKDVPVHFTFSAVPTALK